MTLIGVPVSVLLRVWILDILQMCCVEGLREP